MKKILMILLLVGVVVLSACTKTSEKYVVTEILNETCSIDKDCTTPTSYLIQSNCPYTSKCLNDKCTVVCPIFNGTTYPDVKECGPCPQYVSPSRDWCENGTIVAGSTNECGCIGHAECVNSTNNIQIANPASKFCVDNGGTLNIKTAEDGSQTGYCTIVGFECEEWALFRGECSKIHICTDVEKQAEICTMEYMPVCGSDGKTYGNKCGACSSKVDYWTQGECI